MRIWSLLAAVSLAACGGKSTPAPERTLYDRLGGEDAIKAVVKDLVEEGVTKDPRISARFTTADLPHLEKTLSEQLCEVTHGPCTYTGKDMKTAHQGMQITEDDFAALVDDLKKSLDKFKVPHQEQTDLLNVLAPMKPEIVGQ
jgi:hemoglobin